MSFVIQQSLFHNSNYGPVPVSQQQLWPSPCFTTAIMAQSLFHNSNYVPAIMAQIRFP